MCRFVFSCCIIKTPESNQLLSKLNSFCVYSDEDDVGEEESQLRAQVIRLVPSLTFTRINRL